MRVTHASATRIENVTHTVGDSPLRGCLFFGEEDNTYNLAGDCACQYSIDIENVLEVRRLAYQYEPSDVADFLERMRDESEFFDATDEELFDLLAEETQADDAGASWLVQQYQGLLADNLGFDAAESVDEQGVVYIAYCVGRKLQETVL